MGEPTWQEQDLARAIAFAEGFQVAGSAPQRARNPGDFKLGDLGWGVTGTEGVTWFPTEEIGWRVLYHQLRLIANHTTPGRPVSHVYTPGMTLRAMAGHWTDTAADAWANNVCEWYRRRGLNVTPVSTLGTLLGLSSTSSPT